MSGFPSEAIVVARASIASCELDGESVILNVETGLYHGLNEVGSRIWQLVREPLRVSELRERLLAEFEVDERELGPDLLAVLAEMQRAGLIEVRER
jgi:hypothetical protein